jgi:hypothetical protein
MCGECPKSSLYMMSSYLVKIVEFVLLARVLHDVAYAHHVVVHGHAHILGVVFLFVWLGLVWDGGRG